jgi:hypothetical protein
MRNARRGPRGLSILLELSPLPARCIKRIWVSKARAENTRVSLIFKIASAFSPLWGLGNDVIANAGR